MAINRPLIYFGTAFNADPFDGAATPSWTDLTARFVGLGTAGRGRQYELDQVQAGTMDPAWVNIDEALNPANTSSPYTPNLVPYRQTLFMAQWPPAPVGGATNLLNLTNPDYTIDPSFESYSAGQSLPFWLASGGGVAPVVTTTNPFQGTKAVSYAVSNTGGFFGIGLNVPCIPGKQYVSSWYVRQSAANTTQIFINGGLGGSSMTVTNTYVRLSVSFIATQPIHQLWIGSFTTGISGAVFCDAMQHEPMVPANANPDFEPPLLTSSWAGANGATLTSDATLAHEGGYSLRVTPNGSSAVPQAQSEEIACVAGQDVSIRGWLRSNLAATRTLNVFWFNAAHTFLSASSISGSLSAGAWTLYGPTTFTAPASSAFYRIVSNDPGTPAAASFWNMDQVVSASPSAFTTSGPILRNMWRGYTERWPTRWDGNGYEGRSTTPVVGPFAILNNAYLHTELRNAIMAKAPDYYWPITEPNGSITFAEASGNNGPPLQRVISPLGAGTSTFTAGTQTGVAGDPQGVGIRMAPASGDEGLLNKSFQQLQVGYTSTSQRLTGAGTASGVSGVWSLTSAFVAVRPQAVLTGGVSLIRFADPLSNTSASTWGSSGPGLLTAPTATSDLWGDGKPHIYVNVQTLTTAAGGTFVNTFYVDGFQIGTQTLTGVGAQLRPNMGLSIGGQVTYTFNQAWQDQTTSHVAWWNRALTAFEIADLNNGFKGYPGELSGTRISRYLQLANYLGPTSIAAGSSQLGVSTVTENVTVLAACQAAASSEFGNFFEGATGVTFQARFARYLTTTSAYTIGDQPSSTEYPYLGDINFDVDPNLVVNIADITQSAGVVGHAEDLASQKRYGRKNFARTVSLFSANETIDAATWVVNNGKAPKNRVNGVTLDPGATVNLPFGDGTMWAMIIALEIGTRVTLKRRPKAANAGAGITMSGDYFVEQITHHDIDIGNSTWQTTLQLSPVPAGQPWILENATYGQLDVTTVLGF